MSEVVIVALISLLGTIAGSVFGIITSTKLTTYRIDQLEHRFEELNNLIVNDLIARMYDVERRIDILEQPK